MTETGIFRAYFNRHQAAPLVWCVAFLRGDTLVWEIAVAHVVFRAPARTAYAPKPTDDADDGTPSAYLETYGRLAIEGSIATIWPAGEDAIT